MVHASSTSEGPRVGETLPAVLLLPDLARLLGLSLKRTYALAAAGEFDRWEIRPRIAKRWRFSGKKVQAWIDGETETPARSFRKGAR